MRTKREEAARLKDKDLQEALRRWPLFTFLLLLGCSGWVGMPESLMAQTKYAATSLTIAASSGQSESTFADSNCDGGNCVFYDSTATGQYISFDVTIPAAGTYDIQVGYKGLNSRGKMQTAVASSVGGTYTNVGSVVDQYADTGSGTYPTADLGDYTFSSSGTWVFRFTVTGKDSASSGYTLSFSFIQLTSVPPSPPTSLAATAVSTSQINLTWTASTTSGVTYSIFSSTTSGFTPSSGNQIASGVTTTTYSNTGLTAGTTYYYLAEAIAYGISSSASNQASATTQCSPPTAPSNLGATAASSSQINLSWTASSSSCSVTYSVFRSTTSGFTPSGSNQIATGVSTTSYSNTGLAASTTYYYLVEGVDSGGASAASNQAGATTLAASTVYAFTSLTIAASSGQSESTFADSNCDGGNCVFYDSTATGQYISFDVTIPAAGSYDVRVSYKTINTRGIMQTAIASSVSGTYTNVGPTVDQYSASAGYPTTDLGDYTFSSSGTWVFRFTVTGKDGASSGYTLSFNALTLNPVAPPTPPNPPTSLAATAASASQINLTWTASTTSGVTYSVFRSTTSGFTPSSSNQIASFLTTTSYSDTGLSANTTYYYLAEAVLLGEASTASNQASATTQLGGTQPPTNLAATAVSSNQINLTWTASTTPGATYSIFMSTTSGFTPSSSNQIASGVTTTSYSSIMLSASTTYYYLAEAVASGVSSVASNQASATTSSGSTFNLPPGVLILVDSSEAGPIQVAIGNLQRDLKNVLGVNSTVVNSASQIFGQPAIVVTCKGAATAAYRDPMLTGVESQELIAEGTSSAPVMVLQGADTRGTIFAIYEFSNDYLNIPPLWYWASWTPQSLSEVSFSSSLDLKIGSPNVAWRVAFFNDRDMLTSWTNESSTNLNSVFEMLLRLKYNVVDVGNISDYGGSPSQGLQWAQEANTQGMAITFTHLAPFGAQLGDWSNYWNDIADQSPPTLACNSSGLISSTLLSQLDQFWAYYITMAQSQGFQVIETLALRNNGDEGFWTAFSNCPTTDSGRAAVINQIYPNQLALLKSTWNTSESPLPLARTFMWNEIQQYMAEGYLDPPTDPDLIWGFSNDQWNHYPYTDIMNYNYTSYSPNNMVGYYENLEYYSTGSHLAQGEGPWKQEASSAVASTQAGPNNYVLTEYNFGNMREFLEEASIGGDILWNLNSYIAGSTNVSTDLGNFTNRYFGSTEGPSVATLYTNYYNAYFSQRASDFVGDGYDDNFPQQYIFQDLRYYQAGIDLMNALATKTANTSPFDSHGPHYYYIYVPSGSTELQVVQNGTAAAVTAYNSVVSSCESLASSIPSVSQPFYNVNMCLQAQFMQQVNIFLNALCEAETAVVNSSGNSVVEGYLTTAKNALNAAQTTINDRDSDQSAIFSGWYANSTDFDISTLLSQLNGVIGDY
ncbi:MAG: glycosyl hydrolase 115 family protein [Candidatus Acidiferrales bacterium]